MKISLIVAMDRNGVIGKDGGLPWPRIPEDMRHFRRITDGKEIIVGRKTYERLPSLPGRFVVVLSRTRGSGDFPGCWDAVDRPEDELRELLIQADEGIVIGGAATYAAFEPHVSEAHVTLVDGDHPGDTVFPFPILGSPDWEPAAEPVRLAPNAVYHHMGRVKAS